MTHLREQRQPVAPQRRIFRIDHHAIEEPVDRGAQCREARQRRAVVPFRECALDFGDDAGSASCNNSAGKAAQTSTCRSAFSAFLRMFAMRLLAAVRLTARNPEELRQRGELRAEIERRYRRTARTASNISVVIPRRRRRSRYRENTRAGVDHVTPHFARCSHVLHGRNAQARHECAKVEIDTFLDEDSQHLSPAPQAEGILGAARLRLEKFRPVPVCRPARRRRRACARQGHRAPR